MAAIINYIQNVPKDASESCLLAGTTIHLPEYLTRVPKDEQGIIPPKTYEEFVEKFGAKLTKPQSVAWDYLEGKLVPVSFNQRLRQSGAKTAIYADGKYIGDVIGSYDGPNDRDYRSRTLIATFRLDEKHANVARVTIPADHEMEELDAMVRKLLKERKQVKYNNEGKPDSLLRNYSIQRAHIIR
jgi:hypothetical protein